VKVVDLSLVYKRDAIYNGAFTDSNITIPIPSTALKTTYDEVGVFMQYKW
jgi:hypothetical protein